MRDILEQIDERYNDLNVYDMSESHSLIREVTKEQEMSAMYIRVFNQYISKPKKIPPKDKLNKQAILNIDSTLNSFNIMSKKFDIIHIILKNINDVLSIQWLEIVNTNKQICSEFDKCMRNLKHYGIDDVTYRSISYKLNTYAERMTRINDTILPEYIRLSPLKEYDEELKLHQESLDALITGTLLENKNSNFNDDCFRQLIEDILICCDTTTYKERLDKYLDISRKQDEITSDRVIKMKEMRSKRFVLERLRKYADNTRFNISHRTPGYNINFTTLTNMRHNGQKYAKVVIAGYISSEDKRIYYITEDGSMVLGLQRASIFKCGDPLPSNIKMKELCGEIAVSEVVFSV